MIETHDAKEMVFGIIQHDPLFAILRDTPLEAVLYHDPYLSGITKKGYYSTAEVASWFDITEAKLRYYIRPFEHYIFDGTKMHPKTLSAIRLNLPAILRLRMILLLKDEHRVKGLKLILGIDENGHLDKQQISAAIAIAPEGELANKVEVLGNVLQQMIQTGLFNLEQEDASGALQIAVNTDFLTQNMLVQASESNTKIIEIQTETNKLKYENEKLQKQITELREDNAKDVVVKIRERFIENEVVASLRTEALQQFTTEKKTGFFAKLFQASQIEMEKEEFVVGYIAKHLAGRLEVALIDYYE